jgi:hypothetical protein
MPHAESATCKRAEMRSQRRYPPSDISALGEAACFHCSASAAPLMSMLLYNKRLARSGEKYVERMHHSSRELRALAPQNLKKPVLRPRPSVAQHAGEEGRRTKGWSEPVLRCAVCSVRVRRSRISPQRRTWRVDLLLCCLAYPARRHHAVRRAQPNAAAQQWRPRFTSPTARWRHRRDGCVASARGARARRARAARLRRHHSSARW